MALCLAACSAETSVESFVQEWALEDGGVYHFSYDFSRSGREFPGEYELEILGPIKFEDIDGGTLYSFGFRIETEERICFLRRAIERDYFDQGPYLLGRKRGGEWTPFHSANDGPLRDNSVVEYESGEIIRIDSKSAQNFDQVLFFVPVRRCEPPVAEDASWARPDDGHWYHIPMIMGEFLE